MTVYFKHFVVLLFITCSVICIADFASAQNARDEKRLDNLAIHRQVYEPDIATDGDLTVGVWMHIHTTIYDIYSSISDGRGLVWTNPVRIDSDPGISNKKYLIPVIVGQNIYVAWLDERNGTASAEVYMNMSKDGGVTWTGDVAIDKGYPIGTGYVEHFNLKVVPNTGGPDIVYALVMVNPTGSADDEVRLSTSLDGGVTFSSGLVQQNAMVDDVDYIGLDADGLNVAVVWSEHRGVAIHYNGLYFNVSNNGGATWNHGSDLMINTQPPGISDVNSYPRVDIKGDTVAVAWQEERSHNAFEEARFNISYDRGKTFLSQDILVGGYTTSMHDVNDVQIAVLANGNIVYLESDNRANTVYDIFASVTTDSGVCGNC